MIAARLAPPVANTPLAIVTAPVRQLVEFFMAKGWSAAQSFGIVANFHVESRLIPHAKSADGRFVGLAQWDAARQRTFAQKYGKPVQQATALEQAEFAHWELTNTAAAAGAKLKAAKTPAEAAAVVSRYYERPARDESYSRGALAQRLALAVNLPADVKIEPITHAPTAAVVPAQVATQAVAGAAMLAGIPASIGTFLQQVQAKCGAVKVISGHRGGPRQMCHGMSQAVDYQVANPACAFTLANELKWPGGHTNDYYAHAQYGVPVHFHLSTCRQEAGWRGDHRSYYAALRGGPRRYVQRVIRRVPRNVYAIAR